MFVGNFIVRGQFSRGEGDNYPRGKLSGAQFSSRTIIRGAIIWGAIIQAAIVLGATFLGGNCPRTKDFPVAVLSMFKDKDIKD